MRDFYAIINPPMILPEGASDRAPTKAYRRPGDLCYMETFGFRRWSRAQDLAKQDAMLAQWLHEIVHRQFMWDIYGV